MAGSRHCRTKPSPWKRAQMLPVLAVGTEIIQLRRIARRMDLGSELDVALEALRRGEIVVATAHLDRLDNVLAARPGAAALRARASLLAMTEVLTQHAVHFEDR